ncbi:MAG TPA: hypothetical protein VN709_10915 [Terriglobales bacterium]|nr:hypothetical protein [Terriglobales bacterium]
MRYILILLGIATVALGVVLAREGLWWIAVPDACFGGGVGWIAWASLRDEHRNRRATGSATPIAPEAPRRAA